MKKKLTNLLKTDTVTGNGGKMDSTVAERQRRYRDRLYKAGLKHLSVWVKRKEGRAPEKMSMTEYVRLLKKMTAGLGKRDIAVFLNLQLKVARGRIEEVKQRKKK